MSKSRSGHAKRRAARLAAVQALYQMEISGAGADAAIADQALREPDLETEGKVRPVVDQPFMGGLVRGVRDRRDDIDRMIDGALSEGWAIARLDSVLRAILRAGVCELLTHPEIDAPITINEYVEIAKSFFDGNEPKMTNGVLDRLAKILRAGMEPGGAGGRETGAGKTGNGETSGRETGAAETNGNDEPSG
jgi:N utilization substance protein B